MAMYFFHVIDGAFLVDSEGKDCLTTRQVRQQAVLIASEIINGSAGEFPSGTEWQLHVTNETRRTVFKLKFSSEWTSDTDVPIAPVPETRN